MNARDLAGDRMGSAPRVPGVTGLSDHCEIGEGVFIIDGRNVKGHLRGKQ